MYDRTHYNIVKNIIIIIKKIIIKLPCSAFNQKEKKKELSTFTAIGPGLIHGLP